MPYLTTENLNAILALDGADFIRAAYQDLLGRPADANGLEYYLGRVRSGVRKSRILAEIASSAEARPVVAASPALKALIRSEGVRRRLSFKGVLRRARPAPVASRAGQAYAPPLASDLTSAELAIHRRLAQALATPDDRAR